jgi:hypothetical protein
MTSNIAARSVRTSTLLCVLAVAACGGGGGGGGGNGTNGNGAPSFSLSQTSISAQDATTSTSSKTIVIDYTITNAKQLLSSGFLVTAAVPSGPPVEYSVASSTGTSLDGNTTSGTITIQLWSANVLGAGSFGGNVVFSICHNPATSAGCAQAVAGSPTSIPVTFTVTGAARSAATATLSVSSISLEAPSSATTGPSTSAPTLSLSALIPGPYVTYSQPAKGFVAAVTYTPLNDQTGNLTIAYAPPGTLAPGTYSESLTINVCSDQQCNRPIASSPIVLPVTYTVTAGAGINYVAQTVPILTNDIAWSAAQSKIYAVVSQFSATDPKTLVEIDPTSATITRSLALGGNPRVLSVSDDGAYAYIGFTDQNIVERVALTTFNKDIVINLGATAGSVPIYAGYLAAIPSAPHSVVVSTYANALGLSDNNSEGVFVYDDGVSRGNPFGATNAGQQLNSIAFDTTGSTLYAIEPNYENLYILRVGSTGLSQSAAVNLGQIGFGGYVSFANGMLYDFHTQALNTMTGTITGSFLAPGSFLSAAISLDTALNRAFVFFFDHPSNNGEWTIETFNLSTMKPIALARTNGIVGPNQAYTVVNERIVRWGPNGLAINGELGVQILHGSFVTQ